MQIFMSFFLKSPFPLLRSFPRFIGGHHGCKGTTKIAHTQVLERKKHIKHADAQKHIKNIVLNQKRAFTSAKPTAHAAWSVIFHKRSQASLQRS